MVLCRSYECMSPSTLKTLAIWSLDLVWWLCQHTLSCQRLGKSQVNSLITKWSQWNQKEIKVIGVFGDKRSVSKST